MQSVGQNWLSVYRIGPREATAEWEQLFEDRNRARRLARFLIRQGENFRQEGDSLQLIGIGRRTHLAIQLEGHRRVRLQPVVLS